MDDHKKEFAAEQSSEGCTTVTYQSATVSVPISIMPKINTGDIHTFCCGEPTITPNSHHTMCNFKSGCCSFVLTQNICIEIPVEISAEACVGCPAMKCCEVFAKHPGCADDKI